MPAEFDLLVVGAGPGGSNAAAVALRHGLRVAQVDARPFPRVKPCAGGMTVKACDSIALDLAPTVRRTFAEIEFNAWGRARNTFRHRSRIVTMVRRPEFDNALVRQNQSSERFEFFDGEPVTDIEFDGSTFTLTTTKRRLTAAQLAGADGAYSLVNRIFRIAAPKAAAMAIEVNIPKELATSSVRDVPCLDFGAVARGYGWIFPKDDHYSVGLYTFARLRHARTTLASYARAKGFALSVDSMPRHEAHTIPVGGYRLRTPSAPVYLVGDAGGFADAITGEGIYHALESGRLAGETSAGVRAKTTTHHQYYDDLWSTVLSDTLLTYHAARHFYRDPVRRLRVLENPFVWRPVVAGYGEGATVRKILTHGSLYMLNSLRRGAVGRMVTRELPSAPQG